MVVSKPESYALQFNGPRLEFTVMQAGGVRRRVQAPSGAVVAGRVYHVVGTFGGATQRLFVNGVQSASASLTGAIATNANALNVGSWSGWDEFFKGTVDEAAVYSVALSATQVANHYSAGTATTAAFVEAAAGTNVLTSADEIGVGGTSPFATVIDAGLGTIYVTRNATTGHDASNGVSVIDAV